MHRAGQPSRDVRQYRCGGIGVLFDATRYSPPVGTPGKDRSGFRYQLDRAAQGFGPLRSVDAWGLRHPVVNAISFVFLGASVAVLLSLTWHSWPEGVAAGVVIAAVAILATRANHRRRLRNGTSAEYGPPLDKTDPISWAGQPRQISRCPSAGTARGAPDAVPRSGAAVDQSMA